MGYNLSACTALVFGYRTFYELLKLLSSRLANISQVLSLIRQDKLTCLVARLNFDAGYEMTPKNPNMLVVTLIITKGLVLNSQYQLAIYQTPTDLKE